MNRELRALATVGAGFALVVVSASVGGQAAARGSYIPLVIAGLLLSALSARKAYDAFQIEPPAYEVGWIFGLLVVWGVAFSVEETGWAWWRWVTVRGEAGAMATGVVAPFFEFHVSAVLKGIQAAGLMGLVGVGFLIHRKTPEPEWTSTIRMIMAVTFLAHALLLFALGR